MIANQACTIFHKAACAYAFSSVRLLAYFQALHRMHIPFLKKVVLRSVIDLISNFVLAIVFIDSEDFLYS